MISRSIRELLPRRWSVGIRGGSCAAWEVSLEGIDDLHDLLLGRHAGVMQDDGVRRDQRVAFVERIPAPQVLRNRAQRQLGTTSGQLSMATPRSFVEWRVEKELVVGVGHDDGANIPADHDDVTAQSDLALALAQRRPYHRIT